MPTANEIKSIKSSLKGKLVFLRAPETRDMAEFIALNRASLRFHAGLAAPPRTPHQFSAYLERCRLPNCEAFFVCRCEDNAIVGAINLGNIIRGPLQGAFVGYFVGALFARRGYMTEASQLVLRHAFHRLKLHRVEANIQPANTASRSMAQQSGFRLEGFSPRYLKVAGRWRDHERWAMTFEDWRAIHRKH